MTYYILLLDDKEEDALVLGEESFGVFYIEQGLITLNNIINNASPNVVETVRIFNEKKESFTITEFFDLLAKLTIRYNF